MSQCPPKRPSPPSKEDARPTRGLNATTLSSRRTVLISHEATGVPSPPQPNGRPASSFSRYRRLPNIGTPLSDPCRPMSACSPRIQLAVKLPDGRRFVGDFDRDQTLDAVKKAGEAFLGRSMNECVIHQHGGRPWRDLAVTLRECRVQDKTTLYLFAEDTLDTP